MKNLFLTELLRHRNLATGVAVFHFIVLYYLSTLGVWIHSLPFVIMWFVAQIALGGGFGFYQLSLHKRGNDWLHLLHRPLSERRIFFALALAGWTVCLVASVVPALAMLLALETDAMAGIEAHQYLLLPFVALLVTCSYLCGCFARLGRSRLSFLALLAIASSQLAFLTSSPQLSLLPLLGVWALYLAISAFKPDLTRIPQKTSSWLLTELPIQYGCLWLIVSAVILVQETAGLMSGNDVYRDPAPGTDIQVRQLPLPDMMYFALEQSSHPDADLLRQQVQLGESAEVTEPENLSYRQQLPLAYGHLRLHDAERGITWIFDHAKMLYAGYDDDRVELTGWLGPAGFHHGAAPPAARFPEVPRTFGNEFVIGSHTLHRVDWDNQLLHLRYTHDGADAFTDSLTVTENVALLLSDAKLYLFRTAELRDDASTLVPRAVLDMPPSVVDPQYRRLAVTELIDGYLVAMMINLTPTVIAADFALYDRAALYLYRTREGKANELITGLRLPTSFTDSFIYREFIASPGMRLLTDLYWGLALDKNAERMLPAFFVPFPASVLLLAGLVSAACAALTAWLLRNSAVQKSTKIFWIAGNAFTGLAGLLSLLLGYYWWRNDGLRARKAS